MKPKRHISWLKRLAVALLLSLALLFLREVVLFLTRRLYDGAEGDPLHFLSPDVLRRAFSPRILFSSLGAVFLFALLRGYVSCAVVALGECMGTVNWMGIVLHPMLVQTDRASESYAYQYHPHPGSVYSFYVITGIAIAVVIYAVTLIRRKTREESRED